MRWFEEFSASISDENNIKGFVGPNRWLSNFWPASIPYGGLVFPSVENAYQAEKLDLQHVDQRVHFVGIPPAKAKQLGKRVVLRPDWEQVKLDVMEHFLSLKFSEHNPELKQQLIDTGTKYLEETNWWNDKFWGVCKGVGENNLGKLLMKIRTQLQDGSI